MKPQYEPLPTSSDLAQVSLEAAVSLLGGGPMKFGLTLYVSVKAFEERDSWLDVVRGGWTNGVQVSVVMHSELSAHEWYVQDAAGHKAGSNPP